jgi:hypothetical protein
VPSAKKLIVHGPDLSQIPTQYSIEDNTQFSFIMQEGLDFFGVSDSKKDKHFLFDIKTSIKFQENIKLFDTIFQFFLILKDQIHVPDAYVRNFYFFRRNYYPQLSLVQMETKEALRLLEKTVNISRRNL